MASTIRPIDALDFASDYVKGEPIERQQVRILDDVNKYLWMAAPWRWTIGTVGEITLINGQQDYTLTAPGDMLFPIYAYISDGATTPQYVDIEPKIPSSAIQAGQPTRMSYEGSNNWRFYPVPVITGTKTVVIQYKKVAPVLTASNIYTGGTQVFDDEWFWVYQEGVLWKSYLYADDNRCGSLTFADGKVQMSGKRAEFEAAIDYMRQREKLPIFGYQLSPDPKMAK